MRPNPPHSQVTTDELLGRFQEKRRELAADLLSEVYEFAQLAGHLTIYAQAGNRDSARAQYELLVPAKHRLDTAAITLQLLLDEGTSPMASLQTILREAGELRTSRLGVLHGQMTADDADEVRNRFARTGFEFQRKIAELLHSA
jgi:hypothetical protein